MSSAPVHYPPANHVLPARPDSVGAPGPVRSCVISSQLNEGDRQALLDLFARSSSQTRRDRFHHALSVFPERYLEEILRGEQPSLVARDNCHPDSYGAVIGLASAGRIAADAAEVAVWVDDAWQRRGVGGLLLREILNLLRQRRYREAVGFVESSNLAARRLIQRVCPGATSEADDDIIEMRMPLSTLPRADQQVMSGQGFPHVAT
jgi:RimJ/RimL family protein N-acetyltransferase